jgi:lipopolysaccharide/colanic/teichoic acid biosynthesis glycosyltransferase
MSESIDPPEVSAGVINVARRPTGRVSYSRQKLLTIKSLRNLVYLAGKRIFDVLCSLALLTFAVPVMVIVSIAIRLSSPGPAIYCQHRLTDGGKVFTIFKFRTMSTDAEATCGAVWADPNDQRVIPIGRFLRKTRLDELPQLLNVLIGDMSIVGPRPERPEMARQLAKQLPAFPRRLEVKAGLTGLAQIASGYADDVVSYRKKLAWDILYIKKRSLFLDCVIFIRTIVVVLTGHGAR